LVNFSVDKWIGLALLAFCLYGIIDAAFGRPLSAWKAAGRNRAAWILVQILLPVLGSLVYVLGIRRELSRTRRAAG
jgi:hypothetical protein